MLVSIPDQPNNTTFNLLGGPFQGDYALFVSAETTRESPNPLEEEEGWGRLHSVLESDPDTLSTLLRDPDSRTATFAPDNSAEVGLPVSNFDTGSFANAYYVWSPDPATLAAARHLGLQGDKRSVWMTRRATDACERYGDWLSGRVYKTEAVVFHALRDRDGQIIESLEPYLEAGAEPVYDLAGSNLYGWELVRNEMQDAAETIADAILYPELAL